jgi:hypothetical protein
MGTLSILQTFPFKSLKDAAEWAQLVCLGAVLNLSFLFAVFAFIYASFGKTMTGCAVDCELLDKRT